MGRALLAKSLAGKLFVVTLVIGGLVGVFTGVVRAQQTYCPGEDYCFVAHSCATGCKNMSCGGGQCPDPGEQGENCYTCAAVE